MSANTSTLLSSSIEFKGFYATPPLTRIIMFLSVNPIQFPNPKLKPSQTPIPLLFPINFSLHSTQTPSKTRIRCRCSKSDQQTLPHSVIERIADKLRSLGITETENPTTRIADPVEESNRVGEIFVPYPNQLPKFRVGHTLDPSWSTPDNPVPKPGYGEGIVRYNELRERVERERKEGKDREDKVPSLAELKLPRDELRRLRAIGVKERRKLKVGKAGITEGIVNGIHERWRREEVVKIVCEDLCRQNMKRTHDLLERKTGGLVVWRSGSKIILYRGADYKYPYFLSNGSSTSVTTVDAAKSTLADDGDTGKVESSTSYTKDVQYYTKDVQYYTKDVQYSHSGPTNRNGQPTLVQGVGAPNRVRFLLPGEAQLAEEADRLLDGLGPRFTDWWGYDPLPVDADLLPAVVPGYRKPFRLLPFGIKAKLTDDEMTTLRRLGRPLPCHFALGRNRKLQGLAAAIVKLWEKSEIAKIAIKRGVQNTNSEIMTEELKWLTGGTLLSRDREFIVLYRGKDFLPQAVSSAIEERRRNVMGHIKYPNNVELDESADKSKEGITSHNLTNEADHHTTEKSNLLEQRKLTSKEAAIKQTERKLSRALEKKVHAEKLLSDLAKNEMPQKPDADKEGITEEERYMLRKIGLKMKAFLLMGRRGVFSGTIENMHLHWKYRELVKIICKETNFDDVYHDAQVLEAESGGILVAVERVSKGYAIIVYRGKNYTRPASLRPATLLSKREAMKRSLEAQRYKSLKLHVLELAKNIDELKLQLERDKESQKLQPSDETDSQVKDVTNSMELASPEKLESPLESKSLSSPVGVPPVEEDLEARDEHDEADMNSVGLSDELDASSEAAAPVQQDTFSVGSSVTDVVDISNRESESSFQLESMEHHESLFSDISFRADPMPSHLDETKSNAERPFSHQSSDDMLTNEAMTSTMESASNELKKSFLTVVKKVNPREIHLSNRDRLLLRKQALKMKKRPVLAVGRSNIVTGVAKAIKTHFKKHPLAIVNVKGRAKGTSVQELVFKLEQATGSVLVSQEPSKVILYRGWGADDELGHKGRKNIKDGKTMGDGTKTTVSPELIAAIRLECGLQEKQKENSVPTA